MTKKEKYKIAQEAENILTGLRRSIFYNVVPQYAEEHLKRLDRLKELIPKLRDICTLEFISHD